MKTYIRRQQHKHIKYQDIKQKGPPQKYRYGISPFSLMCSLFLNDDTSLFIIVDNPAEAANILNDDLSKITRWAGMWLVSFNAAKTNSLLLTRKSYKPYHPTLYMQNQPISEIDSHKHLRIYFSNYCSWHSHIHYIKKPGRG